jgi:hypothetical protein
MKIGVWEMGCKNGRLYVVQGINGNFVFYYPI